MKRERAAALGIVSIPGLAPHTPQLTLGSDLEFLSRPEWAALKQAYGLAFRAERAFNPTFMYRAVQSGEVDVISAFSNDGRIAALDLAVLRMKTSCSVLRCGRSPFAGSRRGPVLRRASNPSSGRFRLRGCERRT